MSFGDIFGGVVDEVVTPENVCIVLEREPHWQQNRDRLGVLINKGFSYWDKYQELKPWLFLGSFSVFMFSGYLWTVRGLMKRKRGHRIAEANVLYPLLMAVSGPIAYFTRPDWILPPKSGEPRPTSTEPVAVPAPPQPDGTPAPPAPSGEPAVVEEPAFLAWIDGEAERLRAEDLQFANKEIQRLVRVPGIRYGWQQLPGLARGVIECGRPKPRY